MEKAVEGVLTGPAKILFFRNSYVRALYPFLRSNSLLPSFWSSLDHHERVAHPSRTASPGSPILILNLLDSSLLNCCPVSLACFGSARAFYGVPSMSVISLDLAIFFFFHRSPQ